MWEAGQGPRHIAHRRQRWRFYAHFNRLTTHPPSSCNSTHHALTHSLTLTSSTPPPMSFSNGHVTTLICREGNLIIVTHSKRSNIFLITFPQVSLGFRLIIPSTIGQTYSTLRYFNFEQQKSFGNLFWAAGRHPISITVIIYG